MPWLLIAWFDTFDQAMQDMVDIIEAIGVSDELEKMGVA